MKRLRENFDFLIFGLIVAGFVYVAAQRISDVPLPDTDEAMTLQVPYEMLNRGKIALPMYRYLGGNIENSWHSYTPVYFVLLGGFLKAFGLGLAEGRAFNLVTAVLVLLVVYLLGRRLFDWRAGLVAVVLLASDQIFLARSRLLRNDFAAAMFGLLAVYLYEMAEERKRWWLYVASGMAAGAGVMCHTNLLYILGVIFILMLLRRGWRVVQSRSLYQFGLGAFAVMAYEIIYDIIDYKNFVLQNREDDLHFKVLSLWGWWDNFAEEPRRYARWSDATGVRFAYPDLLLSVFQALTIAALTYLIIRCVYHIRRGNAMSEPRVRVLAITAMVALFFAAVTQRKVNLYMVHLTPWFALSAGILLRDGWEFVRRLKYSGLKWAKPAYGAAIIVIALGVGAYGYQLNKETTRYLKTIRDPELVTFDEIESALREIVPEELCPIALKSGFFWLAFPEKDLCFAHIENRMKDALDIKGNDYALIVRTKGRRKVGHLISDLIKDAHLIGELKRTRYGTISIYYTGRDPRYLALALKRYYFFGKQRGHISEDQIAAAREVWSAGPADLSRCAGSSSATIGPQGLSIDPRGPAAQSDGTITLCSVDLKPGIIYQLDMDAAASGGRWEILALDDSTGAEILRKRFGGDEGQERIDEFFKTVGVSRVRLAVRPHHSEAVEPIYLSRIAIREVSPIQR